MKNIGIMNQLIDEYFIIMNDIPKNPLEEKWNRLYPQIPKPEYSQVCDGYSCMWCGRCPKGEYFKIPEEDLELWNNYQKQLDNYLQSHSIKEEEKIFQKIYKKQ